MDPIFKCILPYPLTILESSVHIIESEWFYFVILCPLSKSDWDPVQYLGYCTLCNCTNPSHPFNPITPYFDTSPRHAGNSCAHSRFHFSFPFWISLKLSLLSHFRWALSVTLPNAPLSQPRLRLHHSLACYLPLPQPRRHRFLHTQLRHISKNKEKTAAHHLRSRPPNTSTLFRPRSERLRVGGWRESGV